MFIVYGGSINIAALCDAAGIAGAQAQRRVRMKLPS